MEKTDLTKIDWAKIQEIHDNGIYWTKLPKIIKISLKVLNRAESQGFIKKTLYIFHPTNEQTKKMSDRMKKFLKENPNKHPWKNHEKFKSAPCEEFKKMLNQSGISFLPEYPPIEDRHYAVDIAFPDKKIAIEINGNQHYDANKKLKPYYQKRHDDIVSVGWEIFEIPSQFVFNKEFVDNIIKKLKNDYNLGTIDYLCFVKKTKKKQGKRKYGTTQDYTNAKKEKYNELNKQKAELLLNSSIDFSKFGWAKKTSELLRIKPQKVKKWMERYMHDFYTKECFKKNYDKNYCSCGKQIEKISKKCESCRTLSSKKLPSIEQLKIDLKNMSITNVAKKYKVRRNSLYKFIKRHSVL